MLARKVALGHHEFVERRVVGDGRRGAARQIGGLDRCRRVLVPRELRVELRPLQQRLRPDRQGFEDGLCQIKGRVERATKRPAWSHGRASASACLRCNEWSTGTFNTRPFCRGDVAAAILFVAVLLCWKAIWSRARARQVVWRRRGHLTFHRSNERPFQIRRPLEAKSQRTGQHRSSQSTGIVHCPSSNLQPTQFNSPPPQALRSRPSYRQASLCDAYRRRAAAHRRPPCKRESRRGSAPTADGG